MTRRRILTGWAIGLLLGAMAAGTALGAESGWKTEDGVLKFVDRGRKIILPGQRRGD